MGRRQAWLELCTVLAVVVFTQADVEHPNARTGGKEGVHNFMHRLNTLSATRMRRPPLSFAEGSLAIFGVKPRPLTMRWTVASAERASWASQACNELCGTLCSRC